MANAVGMAFKGDLAEEVGEESKQGSKSFHVSNQPVKASLIREERTTDALSFDVG
jgi:hypothetical protein